MKPIVMRCEYLSSAAPISAASERSERAQTAQVVCCSCSSASVRQSLVGADETVVVVSSRCLDLRQTVTTSMMSSKAEVTWTPEVVSDSNSSLTNEGHSALSRFALEYGRYHGYISVVVCVLGIVCSLLVVAVLTRRHMLTSSNYMLTALAVCDLITMLSYIPYAIQFYCLYGVEVSPRRNTLAAVRFCLVHANLSVTAHTASIWITVALSAFRYSMVRSATDGRTVSTVSAGNDLRKSRWLVLLVCASCAVVLIPNYLTLVIASKRDPATNKTMYDIVPTSSQLNSTSIDVALNTVNFWIHALIIKLLPCVLMSVFGFLLVFTVRRQRRRSQRLLQGSGKRTAMLVSVIVLFLITEFPQGVLALISGLKPIYFKTLYAPLGDVMDIAALVNNAVNFVLYCAMSRQFRQTFIELFTIKPNFLCGTSTTIV